jgi:hypothetical protein
VAKNVLAPYAIEEVQNVGVDDGDDSNDGGAEMYALLLGAGEEDEGEMMVL